MRRAQVCVQSKHGLEESPLQVIAHARWAAQRGRGPSMPYRGERNPRRALELALIDIGATIADLHTVELHQAAIPMRITQPWLRPARNWLHNMRQALRRLAVQFHIPQSLDDRTIEQMLPELLDLASDLGLPMPPLRRLPARTRWYDPSDPMPFVTEQRLWPAQRTRETVPA